MLGHGALLLAIRPIFCPPTIGGSPKIWTAKTFCPPNANKWRNPPFGYKILKKTYHTNCAYKHFGQQKLTVVGQKYLKSFNHQCHLPKRSKVELWKGVSSLSKFSNKQMSCYKQNKVFKTRGGVIGRLNNVKKHR